MAKMEEKAGKMALFAILFSISISHSLADDVILNVNTKKPVFVTSDKFLSFTLDPTVILTDDFSSNILSTNVERNINIAKALSPAYVRIGGPRSNSYVFERELFPQNDPRFPEDTFSEHIWNMVHEWAGKSGLDLVTCIAPGRNENGAHASWDSRNALDLISFTDRMGYNTSWQLGYECQTRCDKSGGDLGMDVMRLRSMLDAFPRYSKSIIAGPDVVSYKTKLHQQFLLDYFNVAGPALSAITWHPDLSDVSFTDNGISVHHDNLFAAKEDLYKIIGRSTSKKPLWIAESKPEEGKKQFIGAVVWARRLGNAAKLGAQVFMRQPDNSNLFKPTPDFWVSLLHKTLVGPEVLDTKVLSGNRTHAQFYCQCTRPSTKYERGSLTIFGINLTPKKIVANLQGLKIKELHKYILLPGSDSPNGMLSETVLLNNEPLTLVNGKGIPEIKPSVSTSKRSLPLKLPSGGIGFWVIPDLKLKACMSYAEGGLNKNLLKRLTRRLQENENEKDAAHEELIDLPEELMPFVWQNRMRKQRKSKLGLDLEHDPLFRKPDIGKDLEKLERIFKRRDAYEERKFRNFRNRGGFNIFENPDRRVSSEEGPFFKSRKNYNMDLGEEIRAKLEQYKNKVAESENHKNIHEAWGQKSFTDGISGSKDIDTDKAIAALTLISKVENSLKEMEPNKSDVKLATMSRNSKLNPENDDDILMDEVLKTDKAKKTIIPTKIEDQVEALFDSLSSKRSLLGRNTRKADYSASDSLFLAHSPETIGPIQEFPKGDVYPRILEEKKNSWEDKRFLKKTKKTPGVSNLEHDLWIQEGLEPMGNNNDNFNDYEGLWEAESLQNYQNYKDGPKNWNPSTKKTVTNVVKQNNYYGPKDIGAQPIPSPPTSFDIPITQTVHSITKKSRVRSTGEENSSLETMQIKNNEQVNQYKRLKRELGDINSLLNQEMFQQDDNDCQCRVVRGIGKSNEKKDLPVNPDVIIIGSNENIDREEVIEDGSGAHVSEEVIDIVENSPITETEIAESDKVKRSEKLKSSKTTESTPTLGVAQIPELREELNTSTVETSNRDTRDNRLSLRQLFRKAITGKDSTTGDENTGANSGRNSSEGSSSKSKADNSNPPTKGSSARSIEPPNTSEKSTNNSTDKSPGSAKKTRQTPSEPGLFSKIPSGSSGASKGGQLSGITNSAVDKKPSGATKFTLGVGEPILGLKKLDRTGFRFGKLGNKQDTEKPSKLKESIDKSTANLRDRFPPIKPFNALKRESSNLGRLKPAELLDKFKKARETHLATIKTLRDEADTVRTKKAPDVLEKVFAEESAKFEEFRKRRTEELQQLREQLREKRAELLKNYKPELLDLVKKNKQDLENHVERREAGVKKIFDDLVQTVDRNLNDNFPPIANFFKPLHGLRKRKAAEKGDTDDSLNLGLLKIPEIFRPKKNVDDEDEDVSSQEEEIYRHRLFPNVGDGFPFTYFDPRPKKTFDPLDVYRPTKENSNNALKKRHLDDSYERTSEDKTWHFVDGRFQRIARSADSGPKSNQEAKDLKGKRNKFTRRRRHTTQIKEADAKNTAVQDTDLMKISQVPDARIQGSKSNGCSFHCLKTDWTEPCEEFEKKLYKIVRDEDHFTALPVDNLELGKSVSKKKASFKDQDDEKMYRNSKYDITEYNPDLYPGLYLNYPILPYKRSEMLGLEPSQPIQYYWNDEDYLDRTSTPEIYNDYYHEIYDTFPRFTRGQTTDFAPKKYVSDFGVGYQEEDSRKSPNPTYSDLMRYQPFTSRPHVRKRRQVDNEIVDTTDKSMNEIWSNMNELKSDEDLKDLKKNIKDIDVFGKIQDYQKKTEIDDAGKETKWSRIPIIPFLRDEPVENLNGFKTGMDDKKESENGGMIISITVTDLSDSDDIPPFMDSPNFDEQRVPLIMEHEVEDSKSSTELDNFSDRYNFAQSVLTKMNSFLSYLTSWSPKFNF